MSDFDRKNIRKIDGGLLLIFRELLIRRKASEVASIMGLSQSAISHAMTRLRDVFSDPLFIRKSHGLEPTRRAIELGPKVEALLDLAASTLSNSSVFDASQSRRRFNIAWPAPLLSAFGSRIVETFLNEAPNASFASRQLMLDMALGALQRGDVDLAIGVFPSVPPGLQSEHILTDPYCVVARKNHPSVSDSIDLESYLTTGHIIMGSPLGVGVDEVTFDREQLADAFGSIPDPAEMRMIGYVTQFETALLMASSSNALVTCPRSLAEAVADRLQLQILDLPFELEPVEIVAVSRSESNDAGVEWLLQTIRTAVLSR